MEVGGPLREYLVMPVATVRSNSNTAYRSNLAYDANRRRMVHGPLQPMDSDAASTRPLRRGFWSRLLRG